MSNFEHKSCIIKVLSRRFIIEAALRFNFIKH